MSTISDVFDIPESVHQGDFVLRLTEGVTRPAATLGSYVITPQLHDCFEKAMRELILVSLQAAMIVVMKKVLAKPGARLGVVIRADLSERNSADWPCFLYVGRCVSEQGGMPSVVNAPILIVLVTEFVHLTRPWLRHAKALDTQDNKTKAAS